MKISRTAIDGVMVVDTEVFADHRGAFARLYCERDLKTLIGKRRVVQINHSCTAAVGAVRGMHFQYPPYAEMKLVRCLKGKVWDVAVDLRVGSSTFLSWHAEELTPENARMLVIPEGCAHGFQALATNSELLYLHTSCYQPDAEGGVSHDDPRLQIHWPAPITDISLRDTCHPLITSDFHGIAV